MTDEIDSLAQDWLCGRTDRDDTEQVTDPFERFARIRHRDYDGDDKPDLDLATECILEALERTSPHDSVQLPYDFVSWLYDHMEWLASGRESYALRKSPTRKANPYHDYLKAMAVGYVGTCRAHNLEDDPIATICDLYGVTRRTVHLWIDKYKEDYDDHRGLPDWFKVLEFYGSVYQRTKHD